MLENYQRNFHYNLMTESGYKLFKKKETLQIYSGYNSLKLKEINSFITLYFLLYSSDCEKINLHIIIKFYNERL